MTDKLMTCKHCGSDSVVNMPAKAVGGMAAGGLVGSVVPVIGTGLGAIIGGAAGAVASLVSDSNSYIKVCTKCKKTN